MDMIVGLLDLPIKMTRRLLTDRRTMTLDMSAALTWGLIGGMICALGDLTTRLDRQEAHAT